MCASNGWVDSSTAIPGGPSDDELSSCTSDGHGAVSCDRWMGGVIDVSQEVRKVVGACVTMRYKKAIPIGVRRRAGIWGRVGGYICM